MKRPLLSVLMTAFNRQKYIGEAIESVLASSVTDFELLIVDDHSTDATVSIARKYERLDERVRVSVNPKNLGDYPNRNMASSKAVGEYMMFVDSDDTVLPDGIRKCVEAISAFPHSNFGMYYEDKAAQPFCLTPEEAIRTHFFKKPFLNMGPGGTIIRRSFFEKIGKYPVEFGPASDNYFNLKAACQSPIVMLPFEFMNYRIHAGQEINNKFAYLFGNYNYMEEALTALPLPLTKKEKEWLSKKNKRRFFVNLLKHLRKTRNFSSTREALNRTNYSFRDALQGVFH